jgi:hypothetical protein
MQQKVEIDAEGQHRQRVPSFAAVSRVHAA